MSSTQNVGRDELAAMLGASHASDMVAAAGTTANDLSNVGVGGVGTAAAGTGGSRKHHLAKGGVEEDISKMDRAQAAALVARKFAGGAANKSSASAAGGGAAGGATRHRAVGKRKRKLQHHLLVGDLMEQGVSAMEEEEDVTALYQKDQDEKEEEFVMRADASGAARRKKAEAKVLMRRRGDDRPRIRHSSDSDSSDSESSSSSSDGSSQPRSRRRGRNDKERRSRRSTSNSSSSSSSEDEADIRRRRAREQRAQRNQNEGNVVSSARGADGEKLDKDQIIDEPVEKNNARDNHSDEDDAMSVDEKNKKEKQIRAEPQHEEVSLGKNRQVGRNRRSKSDSSSSSSGSSSSRDSSSSSDQSSSDESDRNSSLPMSVSKPLFVPKSKRGTVVELEMQQQKMDEAEQRRAKEAEKKVIQSRALVAEAVSAAGKNGVANDDEGDEFDTGETGGEFLSVPDDTDPTEESPDKVQVERDAWEVRELIRILRDVDDALAIEKERKELGRRRALTDEERLEEDRRSGRYRAPGETRRAGGKKDGENNYLQRFHHRGAFYMDEDTLQEAGKDDVRHRAAEYSRAATGEDKIDKSALPEVMQVKRFGLAGYSTKYKGLAKEDTTDRKQEFLPIRKRAGRNGRNKNGDGGDGGRDREIYENSRY